MYVGGYGRPGEGGFCVFLDLCQVGFLVVGVSPSVLLLYALMSYVNCGNDE